MGVRFSLPAQYKSMKPKLIVIVGPTASGKSDLAVNVAREYNGEVISADSRQVYTGLDIGTGKITQEEMQGVHHHLLDIADPRDQFTVIQWKEQAEKIIADIITRGKVPIICGGTGFYISTLIDNVYLPDVPANEELRAELSSKTPAELFALLETEDAAKAKSLNNSDRNNPRRLIRALEIARSPQASSVPEVRESTYDPLWIGLDIPIDELRAKIDLRLEKRLNQGMIGEIDTLHKNGLSWERMEELGLEYRFVAEHLQGKLSAEKMREKLATEIGQYAKRQMTWFRRNKNIQWFAPKDIAAILSAIEGFLKKS